MIRLLCLGLSALLLSATLAEAQTPQPAPSVNMTRSGNAPIWATPEACLAEWATAPKYEPGGETCDKKYDANEFRIGPHPTGGCFLIALPTAKTKNMPTPGRGWVAIEPGRPFTFNVRTGKEKELSECCNENFDMRPPPVVAAAPQVPQTLNLKLGDLSGKIEVSGTVNHVFPPVTVSVKQEVQAGGNAPPRGSRFAWMNWKRKSGKVFWITVPSLIAGSVACAVWCDLGDAYQSQQANPNIDIRIKIP